MTATPDMRKAAFDAVDTAWENSIQAGAELERCLDRLSEALRDCSEKGGTITIQFERKLVEKWWILYQEVAGAMIPRQPEDPPPMMKTEDQITAAAALHIAQ